MKKILSIASVAFITTAICALNVNASSECCKTVHRYSNDCKMTKSIKVTSDTFSGNNNYDSFIDELLKDCETKYFDNCNYCQSCQQNPDQKPQDTKPVIPEQPDNKPNNENNEKPDNIYDPSDKNEKIKQEILQLVNQERKAIGLSPLSSGNAKLTSAAQKRAGEQVIVFSHTRPDGSKWSTVLSENGIKYTTAGENVAYGQKSAKEVMTAWMNSSGHRANILNADFSEIGIGVYYKNGTYYWSQLFIG